MASFWFKRAHIMKGREKVKTYTNPKGYQAIQDHGNQPIQIPM